ncbi:hypothetical protein Tco_0243979 [Tanacetum coccineum]
MSVKTPTYVNLESSSEEHQNEKTPSPPPRKKSLSPPHAPSKSTSSRITHYTSSSSPTESPTLTHERISHKRTKNQSKRDKTGHGMEKCVETKPNQRVDVAKIETSL